MSNFLKIVNIFDILLIEYRNGTKSRLLLPLRHGDGRAVPSRRPTAGGAAKSQFHNGTDSRDLLPLRHGYGRAMPLRRPTTGVLRKRHFHNGTKSRLLLPLWQGDGKTMPSRRPTAGVLQKDTSTTAPNHGFCCRCGKETEGQLGQSW